MVNEKKDDNKKDSQPYKIKDAMKVTEDIFNLNKDKNYNPGAFIHGLIFALEATQQSYKIPQQQLAEIKRGCRKYIKELSNIRESNNLSK